MDKQYSRTSIKILQEPKSKNFLLSYFVKATIKVFKHNKINLVEFLLDILAEGFTVILIKNLKLLYTKTLLKFKPFQLHFKCHIHNLNHASL